MSLALHCSTVKGAESWISETPPNQSEATTRNAHEVGIAKPGNLQSEL